MALIVRPQGRRGEVVAEMLTDFPERFRSLRQALLERPGGEPEAVRVEDAWPHKGRIVLKFFGVDSIAQAERLRGAQVLIPRTERIPLGPHQYYLWELEGCRVVIERDGPRREIGTVTDVELTGGVDLLHVAAPGREVLIPLAQDICKQIDPETKTILIDPPDDLLELNE
ncbi:MAG: ribosome maturation factor RimM [Acidobacteriia bacterium]|nr:ribosome maturation factor RimM [Terriglobia bacterium]